MSPTSFCAALKGFLIEALFREGDGSRSLGLVFPRRTGPAVAGPADAGPAFPSEGVVFLSTTRYFMPSLVSRTSPRA
eukprot:scaffold1655_cov247-Pinguiococcus_pyrenoidosus.AAC.14